MTPPEAEFSPIFAKSQRTAEVYSEPLSPTTLEVSMARRPSAAPADPLADLARKVEILEREMATQRLALDRLKAMGKPRRTETARAAEPAPIRRTA
jgi:hypothetical protein